MKIGYSRNLNRHILRHVIKQSLNLIVINSVNIIFYIRQIKSQQALMALLMEEVTFAILLLYHSQVLKVVQSMEIDIQVFFLTEHF